MVARTRIPTDNVLQLSALGQFGNPSTVKQIVAVIKPYLAERVLHALRRAPLEACSIREVKGYGRQKSYLDDYGDSEYSQAFLPKVEITLWVEEPRVEEIIRKIIDVARTGRIGDGKIMVLPVQETHTFADALSNEDAENIVSELREL